MDNVPLFDRKPSEFTFEDFKHLYDDGVSPVTFEYDEDLYEEFRETVLYGYKESVVGGLGTFRVLAQWCGGDGHEQGVVTEHVDSGVILMATGTYSSWDSSDWDGGLIEAEAFTFTETRYKEKK